MTRSRTLTAALFKIEKKTKLPMDKRTDWWLLEEKAGGGGNGWRVSKGEEFGGLLRAYLLRFQSTIPSLDKFLEKKVTK